MRPRDPVKQRLIRGRAPDMAVKQMHTYLGGARVNAAPTWFDGCGVIMGGAFGQFRYACHLGMVKRPRNKSRHVAGKIYARLL